MKKLRARIYIDGSNTFHTQKKLGWLIDWKKLNDLVVRSYDVLDWKYYVGIKDNDSCMKGFLKYLSHVGIRTITEPLKKIKIPIADILTGKEEEKWIYKANFDVEITADILKVSYFENLEKLIRLK